MAKAKLLPQIDQPFASLELTKDEAYYLARLLGCHIYGNGSLCDINAKIWNELSGILSDKKLATTPLVEATSHSVVLS